MADSSSQITTLGALMEFQGEASFEGTFKVDGKFQGVMQSSGTLAIGEKGSVKGNLKVQKVTVSGKHQGNISSANQVTIESTGAVHGDVECEFLEVKKGARLTGNTIM